MSTDALPVEIFSTNPIGNQSAASVSSGFNYVELFKYNDFLAFQ